MKRIEESTLTNLLCDVHFKITLEIDWIKPPENIEEESLRKQHEEMLRGKAHKMSIRLTHDLLGNTESP